MESFDMELEAYFNTKTAKKLLHNKFVVFLGDSVQRSCYKDLVLLLQENRTMTSTELRSKGEPTFIEDKLVERSKHLSNSTTFKEIREYKTDHHLVRFYFITRAYNDYVELILKDFEDPSQPTPDVVILNSSVWDISSYRTSAWQKEYQSKLEKLFAKLDQVLPIQTCIIWRNALPVGSQIKASLLLDQYALKNQTLPADIVLANVLAHSAAVKHKYDVVDMFFHFILDQNSLAGDGLHWNAQAHRKMTDILLIHISKAWLLGLPESEEYQESENSNFQNFADDDFQPPTSVLNLQPSVKRYRGPRHRSYTCEENRYGGPISAMFQQQKRSYSNVNHINNENNVVHFYNEHQYGNGFTSSQYLHSTHRIDYDKPIPPLLDLNIETPLWDQDLIESYNPILTHPLRRQQRPRVARQRSYSYQPYSITKRQHYLQNQFY